ncbi:hypothetical protein AB4865_03315 [Capnocytophaga sp. ARDL2]|uniref:hypothetical protein n=1 Tax=Capnocytophaga sp. ARDL2 TaxID=3238809 RepID=UPI0035589122
MNKRKVTEEAKEKIKKNITKIANDVGKAPTTIYRMLYVETHRLEQKVIARAIRRYTKLRVEDLYESE